MKRVRSTDGADDAADRVATPDPGAASALERDSETKAAIACVQELATAGHAVGGRISDPRMSPDGRWMSVVSYQQQWSLIRLYRRVAVDAKAPLQPASNRDAVLAAAAAIEVASATRVAALEGDRFPTADAKSHAAANVALALVGWDAHLASAAWRLVDVGCGDAVDALWEPAGATLRIIIRTWSPGIDIALDDGWRAGGIDRRLETLRLAHPHAPSFRTRIACATRMCTAMYVIPDVRDHWAIVRVFYSRHGGRECCTTLFVQDRGPCDPRLVPEQPWSAVVGPAGLSWLGDTLRTRHEGRTIEFRPGDYAPARDAVRTALATRLPVPELVAPVHGFMDSFLLFSIASADATDVADTAATANSSA